MNKSCIFCQIVKNDSPTFKIWENDKYLAFLSIYPNTPGVSVIITKEHYDSDVLGLPDEVYHGLLAAAKTVGQMLTKSFDDVGRTGMVFDGFGVDHAHVKLFPMHGTVQDEWQQIPSINKEYYEKYPGFISGHSSRRADDEQLLQLAQTIRQQAL